MTGKQQAILWGVVYRSEDLIQRALDGESFIDDKVFDCLSSIPNTLRQLLSNDDHSTLSETPNGYLPARHPKHLPNTVASISNSVHPALRPQSQDEQ